MRVLDLFSGIGGFSLGLERAGMETVAFCEIEEFPQKVLRKHWPDVCQFHDIAEIDGYTDIVLPNGDVVEPDVICGGFPCQAFSTASHGRKVAKDLWPEMRRVVWLHMPKWVIAENVQKKPIEKAKKDLELLNYAVWIRRIGAHEAGADHKRDRWWLVAHADNQSEFYSTINAKVAELPELCEGVWSAENYASAVRVSDGVSAGMDRRRLKALGNAVVPQIPEIIGRAIMEIESCPR